MKRLYRKIYLTIIGSLVLVVLVAGAVWHFGGGRAATADMFDLAGKLALTSLPPADAPRADQEKAVARLSAELGVGLALFDGDRAPIAAAGAAVPAPGAEESGGFTRGFDGPAWTFPLPDGRWLVAGVPPRHRSPLIILLVSLGLIAGAVGISAYPVARGLTRRLERLQTGVETLGSGDLAARVEVRGKDEVARLAESFNRAAARIEDLVEAHRMLLANASHELRTPLTRIRLGLDLAGANADPRVRADLARDIAELDRLIDEILLASRLDSVPALAGTEPVDLMALAAEEGARYDDFDLSGDPVTVTGDPRLLRRLIRNLLENAAKHGRPPVRIEVGQDGGRATLTVLDGGDGIPDEQRDKVFAPFYRLSGEASGAGLGLSLVRQIARHHGGEATVTRDAASGLNGFAVTLPLRPQPM